MKEFNRFQQHSFDQFVYSQEGKVENCQLTGLAVGTQFENAQFPIRFLYCSISDQRHLQSSGRVEILGSEILQMHIDPGSVEFFEIRRSNLRSSIFRQLHCYRSQFSHTNFKTTDFRNSELIQSEFSKCTFESCDLSYSTWKNCFLDIDVDQSMLTRAEFKSCTFVRTDFEPADIELTEFVDCIFVNCQFSTHQISTLRESNLLVQNNHAPQVIQSPPSSEERLSVSSTGVEQKQNSSQLVEERTEGLKGIRGRFGALEIGGDL